MQGFRNGGYLGLFLREERADDGRSRLVIHAVRDQSTAARLGFRAGDVILKVTDIPVRNGDHFLQLLWATDPKIADRVGAPWRSKDKNAAFQNAAWHSIRVRRGKRERSISASLPQLDKKPARGDVAADFFARPLKGRKLYRLYDALERRKRPLVLVFGSFT